MITIYPNNENVSHENEYYIDAPNFWYLHGKLADFFDYDKAEMYVDRDSFNEIGEADLTKQKRYIKTGIYTVKINGYKRKCRAYLWRDTFGNSDEYVLRGLIVDAYRIRDNLYAYKHYKDKSIII